MPLANAIIDIVTKHYEQKNVHVFDVLDALLDVAGFEMGTWLCPDCRERALAFFERRLRTSADSVAEVSSENKHQCH